MDIPVKPLVLKDVLLTIGEDGYQKHVSGVTFTPTAAGIQWQGLDASESFSDVATATWACGLNYVQDWETEDSLSAFLFEHEGETVPMTFTPKKGESAVSFTSDVTITPGAIGGEVNQYATTSVSLGATKPQRIVTPPDEPIED